MKQVKIDVDDSCSKVNSTTGPAHGCCDGEMPSGKGLAGMVFPFAPTMSWPWRRLKRGG